MKQHTDTELLDFLQTLTNEKAYTGKVVCRLSCTGRGWRLHETSNTDAVDDVRLAIENLIEELNSEGEQNGQN